MAAGGRHEEEEPCQTSTRTAAAPSTAEASTPAPLPRRQVQDPALQLQVPRPRGPGGVAAAMTVVIPHGWLQEDAEWCFHQDHDGLTESVAFCDAPSDILDYSICLEAFCADHCRGPLGFGLDRCWEHLSWTPEDS